MNFLKALPEGPVRRTLSFSVLDAILWSVMFGFAENFIVPFALLFGATVFEVSLLQGTANLAVGTGQLVGGSLVQRVGSRRKLAMFTTAFHACGWLLIFGGTVITGSAWVAIVLYCLFLFVANWSGPGWMSWMNELVPADQRGHYWSWRNSVAGMVQFLAIAAAGVFLYESKRLNWEVEAYGVLFGLAFVARLGGVVSLRFQHEPPMRKAGKDAQVTFLKFLAQMKASNFGRFALFSVFLTFAVQMIYPIIQVYLLKELKLDYLQYSIIMMTFTIASFVFMLYWGPLSDRFGNRRILLVSATLLPLASLAWLFVTDWKLLVLLQLVSGFLVAGVNLSTTNFIFDSIKPDQMAKSVSYFNALNTTFAFLGALAGGALADLLKLFGWQWGLLGPLTTVFLVITVFRVIVLLVFAKGFGEVRDHEPSPGLRYFYIYKPYQDASGWLLSAPRKLVRKIYRRKK